MGQRTVEVAKEQIVDQILANSTYQPNAGLIVQLRASLLKLSKSDLGNLKLIVELKMDEAAEALREAK